MNSVTPAESQSCCQVAPRRQNRGRRADGSPRIYARRWRPPSAVLLVALIVGFSLPAEGHGQLEPLRISDGNPLYGVSYTTHTEGPDLVAPGAVGVGFGTTYSNIFEYQSREGLELLLDTERMTNELIVRYGVSDWVELGGRVALRTDWGGVLDPVIEGFHNAFNLANGGRANIEQGQVDLFLEKDGEILFDRAGASGDPEDLRFFLKGRLLGSTGSASALSVRGAVKVPTGVSATSTGRTDSALHLLGRHSTGDFHLYGQLGVVRFAPLRALETYANDFSFDASAGFERRLGERWSMLSQLLVATPYYSGFDEKELDRLPINLAVGLGLRPAPGWLITGAFVEDLPGDTPAVDLSLHLRLVVTPVR